MPQNDFPLEETITCENITDEIVTFYKEKGYSLVFVEEVMRYDLSQLLPPMEGLPDVTYLTWNSQSIPAFFAVYEAAFRERPGFPGWSEEVWSRWVSDDPLFRPDLSFLALVEGQAVGFVTNAEDKENGYLTQVGVRPQWRGRRLGAELVVRSLQAWQAEGKEAVLLHVNENNPGAIRLYLQLGFVTFRRRGKFSLE